jgi:hypothetical protein
MALLLVELSQSLRDSPVRRAHRMTEQKPHRRQREGIAQTGVPAGCAMTAEVPAASLGRRRQVVCTKGS